MAAVLKRFRYFSLSKAQRAVLYAYMRRQQVIRRQHLSRLIAQYCATRSPPLKRVSRTGFARKYGPEDVQLLAETDSLHETLSGPATKVLLTRAFAHFGDPRFARLSQISVLRSTTCAPASPIAGSAKSGAALELRR